MARLNDKYLFNNTAISLVSILATLQQSERMDLANVLLINPFLLHADTLNFIIKPNIKIRGIEEFLEKFPNIFVDFPERYKSSLVISVNCIAIGIETEYLRIEDNVVYPTPKLKKHRFPEVKLLGKRATNLIKASSKLANLLQANSLTLYLNLRVPL